MIYTDLTKKAMKLMYDRHKDQIDKSGMPYVFHPMHVAEQMNDEYTTIVGLLHDIVEDTDVTLEDLDRMEFPIEIIEAIKLMTHKEGVPYFDYVKAIGDNDIARKVKIADLEHNMDVTRLNEIDEWTKTRLEKYRMCHDYLCSIELTKNSEHVGKVV